MSMWVDDMNAPIEARAVTTPEIRPATKPCPFCGESTSFGYERDGRKYAVHPWRSFGSCKFAECSPNEHELTQWNTRPIEDALRTAAQERDRQIAVLEQERDDDTALIRRLNATVAAQAEEIERLKAMPVYRLAPLDIKQLIREQEEAEGLCPDRRCGSWPHHHAVEIKTIPPDGVSYSGLVHPGYPSGCADCAALKPESKE